MSRKKSSPGDSLELMLDTICNTFGGVLFIAILVIVMLQMAGDDPASGSETEALAAAALHDQQTKELDQLKLQLSRATENLASQSDALKRLAPADSQHLIDELAAAEQDLQMAQNQLSARRKSIEQMNQTTDKMIAAEASLNARSSQAASTVRQLRSQLEQQRSKQRTELKTTALHAPSTRQEVALVLQYDRLYVWHHYDRFGRRSGLNTDDFLVTGEEGSGVVTTPHPFCGLPLDDSSDLGARIRQQLQPFNPGMVHFVIVVRPDSFDSFSKLRSALSAAGFEYRLLFGDGIVDRGGTGGKVQR